MRTNVLLYKVETFVGMDGSGGCSAPQSCRLFLTPWTVALWAPLSFSISLNWLIYAHWVGDAIQPSCPLVSPSPPAFNPSQHQGSSSKFGSSGSLYKWQLPKDNRRPWRLWMVNLKIVKVMSFRSWVFYSNQKNLSSSFTQQIHGATVLENRTCPSS